MKGLEELERLANAATKGPWISTGSYVWTTKGNGVIDMPLTHGYDSELYKKDADYIASFSPDVILSLLRELRIAQRTLDLACTEKFVTKEWIDCLKRKAQLELYPETEQP